MNEPEAPAECPTYVEHAPDPELARYIECYWSVSCRPSMGARRPWRVLPDGCMDIIFNLGDTPRQGRRVAACPAVIGTMTRAIAVEYHGRTEIVGVRFRPGGGTPWVDAPAFELTDKVVGLENLWGAEAGRAHEILGEVAAGRRFALLDEILIGRLRATTTPADRRVLCASEAMAAHDGSLPIERLANATTLGRRQLERRFLDCVGVPPKTASRIARFRSAVSRMHIDPARALARIALDAGYADQAHMNRDFRALAGIAPGAYVAELRNP